MNPDYLYSNNKKRTDAWRTAMMKNIENHMAACRQENIVRIFITPRDGQR